MDENQMPGYGDMSWLQSAITSGGLGSALGGLLGMFGNKNPAGSANQYLDQIPGQTEKYYSPYIDAGKGAMETLKNQYADLLGGKTQGMLGESFKESPGYKWKLDQALKAGHYASQGGGYAGTPQDQQYAMQTAMGIADQDYNNYLQNQMGLYGLGLQGTQGTNQMGYDASKSMADTIGNYLSQKAGYNYAGQAGKNAAKAGGLGNLFSGLGMAAGSFLPHWFGG